MAIMLSEVMSLTPMDAYKVHFARWNGKNQPLETFARSFDSWRGWQEYRPVKDDFNREFIFSLMQVYYETDSWLFGGIWRVTNRLPEKYEVDLVNLGKNFIGRLKIKSSYRGRTPRTNLENHLDTFEVAEILPTPYTGRNFPGYSDIDLSFDELHTIIRNGRLDWRAALEHMKGVYLITDVNTGKRYVGSAYSDQGLWSRWCSYVDTGHGGNKELKELVVDPSLDYCRANFRFALLEHISAREPDEKIISRENFWKTILLSRGEYGLNSN